MPTGRTQPTERRARSRLLVEMKRLRVEARRKGLDLVGRKQMASDLGDLADADVLVEFHGDGGAASGASAAPELRAKIGFTVSVISRLPAGSTSSNRNLTRPISGRVREGRLSSTVARTVSAS